MMRGIPPHQRRALEQFSYPLLHRDVIHLQRRSQLLTHGGLCQATVSRSVLLNKRA